MRTVKLLSWHPESAAKAASLAHSGLKIDASPLVRTSAVVGELAGLNPAALVLDLDKLPSYSREISLMLRASKSARHIPILFAGSLPAEGAERLPDKHDRLRTELPDIPYTTWGNAPKALRTLLKHPPTSPPVVPIPRTYTASLAQKLGIVAAAKGSAAENPGTKALSAKALSAKGLSVKSPGKLSEKVTKVALLAAPDEFICLLGDLPPTVAFSSRIAPDTTLAICFIRSLGDLAVTLDLLVFHLPPAASAWIAYPKRVSNPHIEFNENHVRELALAAGLVDYKICSIDAVWSAMKFARRKPRNPDTTNLLLSTVK